MERLRENEVESLPDHSEPNISHWVYLPSKYPSLFTVILTVKPTLMIHRAKGYYSIKDYARLCGVSPRNIADRLRARSVRSVKVQHFHFINVYHSPPLRRINRFKPVRSEPSPVMPFSFDGLREVGVYARGKHFTEGIIYEWIITGKLDCYVIGDKVFIRPESVENLRASA